MNNCINAATDKHERQTEQQKLQVASEAYSFIHLLI